MAMPSKPRLGRQAAGPCDSKFLAGTNSAARDRFDGQRGATDNQKRVWILFQRLW